MVWGYPITFRVRCSEDIHPPSNKVRLQGRRGQGLHGRCMATLAEGTLDTATLPTSDEGQHRVGCWWTASAVVMYPTVCRKENIPGNDGGYFILESIRRPTVR